MRESRDKTEPAETDGTFEAYVGRRFALAHVVILYVTCPTQNHPSFRSFQAAAGRVLSSENFSKLAATRETLLRYLVGGRRCSRRHRWPFPKDAVIGVSSLG